MAVPDTPPQSSKQLSGRQLAAAATLFSTVSPLADELGELFGRSGHELALVGGPVRDVLLGRLPLDLDLTTDAQPRQVLELIGPWADAIWTTGIDFGTVGLRKDNSNFEITTYRSEHYQRHTRKPDVQFGTSLIDDLARRDFTVNAMAVTLPDHAFIDPFGGLTDLRGKVLRTPASPADSFGDDPLRILRAARFAAQLGFEVTEPTRAAMTELAPRLAPPTVSAERISGELTKLLTAQLPGGPAAGIALLVDTKVADEILPEVPAMQLETDEHHRHKDVYHHSLTVLTQAIALEERYGLVGDLRLRLAALLHDIGKPKTRRALPGGRVGFHHHEVVGAKMARKRLTELRFAKEIVNDVERLVELHLRFHGYGSGEWTDSAVRRYVTDAGPLLSRLHALTRADCTTRNQAKAQRLARSYDSLEQRIEELGQEEELAKLRPDLDGHEIMAVLGVPPGPVVGKAYDYMLDVRIEHGPMDHERAVAELRGWAEAQGLQLPDPAGSDPPVPDSTVPDSAGPESASPGTSAPSGG
jgi:poly(A) polymerase